MQISKARFRVFTTKLHQNKGMNCISLGALARFSSSFFVANQMLSFSLTPMSETSLECHQKYNINSVIYKQDIAYKTIQVFVDSLSHCVNQDQRHRRTVKCTPRGTEIGSQESAAPHTVQHPFSCPTGTCYTWFWKR